MKEPGPDNPIMVLCHIVTEAGCDPRQGEYTLLLTQFIGELDLNQPGGVDDISLIRECIENNLRWDRLPDEGMTDVLLKESGEWEDVFWHKYYTIVHQVVSWEATA